MPCTSNNIAHYYYDYAMKAWSRNNCDTALINLTNDMPTSMAPFRLLWDAVYESMTPGNIREWFFDCGYIV
jgi:hypothetical protein